MNSLQDYLISFDDDLDPVESFIKAWELNNQEIRLLEQQFVNTQDEYRIDWKKLSSLGFARDTGLGDHWLIPTTEFSQALFLMFLDKRMAKS